MSKDDDLILRRDDFRRALQGIVANLFLPTRALIDCLKTRWASSHLLPDLEEAIDVCTQALGTVQLSNDQRLYILAEAGDLSLKRYTKTNHPGDLEESLGRFRERLRLCDATHPGRRSALYTLAKALSRRGTYEDTDEAISLFRQSLVLIPAGHADRAIHLDTLGCELGNRFQMLGSTKDLDEAIALLQEAVALRPPGHSARASSLAGLGLAYRDRAVSHGDIADVDRAIELFVQVIDLPPSNGSNHASSFYTLSLCHFNRFAMADNLEDLDKAVAYDRRTLNLARRGDSSLLSYLNRFYIDLRTRFQWNGSCGDLDEAINVLRETLELLPSDSPRHWKVCQDLSDRLRDRERFLRRQEDLDEAVNLLRVSFQRMEGEDRSALDAAQMLASALSARYSRRGDKQDIDDAIALLRAELDHASDEHPSLPNALETCAEALATRFDRFTCANDLDAEIVLYRQLEELTRHKFHHASALRSLGDALRVRFLTRGRDQDLEDAIQLLRDAVTYDQEDDDTRSECLSNLGLCLDDRFKISGHSADMDEAIALQQSALELTPIGHVERSVRLNYLGVTLFNRFEHMGMRVDLDEAIAAQEEALELRPAPHHNRHQSLDSLGTLLHSRYYYYGRLSDLDDSIAMYREALLLRPDGHVNRSETLNNLGGALGTRAEDFGMTVDLDESILLHREDLSLSTGHSSSAQASSMTNLGTALLRRFERSHIQQDFDEGIEMHRCAVKLRPVGDPNRVKSLSNLGHALMTSFHCFGREDHLNEAVSVYEQRHVLTPSDHEGVHMALYDLYEALETRSRVLDSREDYETALRALWECLEGTPPGSRDRSTYLMTLSHHYHFNIPLANIAMELFAEAITDSSCPPRQRLKGALTCLREAERAEKFHGPRLGSSSRRSKLAANYQNTVRLLPQVAALDLDVPERLSSLKESEELCILGASHYLLLQQPEKALEILEEGRAVFWSQALRLRSEYDDLQAVSPDLAKELIRVSQELNASESSPSHAHSASSSHATDKAAMEREVSRRRRLGERFEDTLERIRTTLPGFDRFLLGETFSSLAQTAAKGPVVVLVASQVCCRAIIIPDTTSGTYQVEFPAMSQEWVRQLGSDLADKGGLRGIQLREADRHVTVQKRPPMDEHSYLSELWRRVVRPVIESLRLPKAQGRERPRLWWCPTGSFTFLPLHAAGLYTGSEDISCSDYVVSSYTPTLTALHTARRSSGHVDMKRALVLLAAAPNVTGWASLSDVAREMDSLKSCVPPQSMLLSDQQSMDVSPETILRYLPRASIFHLACHGTQDDDALESGFVLQGGRLIISQLINLNLPHAQFAFLSACETAKGDAKQPDQTVHLAAAMLFVGFKSVVGTMWSMGDADGPLVVETIYKRLFACDSLDLDTIPYALDEAVQTLRSRVAPARWATYIHVGI